MAAKVRDASIETVESFDYANMFELWWKIFKGFVENGMSHTMTQLQ